MAPWRDETRGNEGGRDEKGEGGRVECYVDDVRSTWSFDAKVVDAMRKREERGKAKAQSESEARNFATCRRGQGG